MADPTSDTPLTGWWCCHSSMLDETISPGDGQYHSTKESAIAAGRIEHDLPFAVSRVEVLTAAVVASAMIVMLDVSRIEEHLVDNEWPIEDQVIEEPTDDQRAELEDLVAAWFEKHKLVGSYWRSTETEEVIE